MKVLIFQGYVDPEGRDAHRLLEVWPTLPGVAEAVAGAGCEVHVVVAAGRDEEFERDGVRYRFVAERRLPSPRRLLGYRAAPHPARSLRATAAHRPDVLHLHGLSFPRQARALRDLHPRAAILVQDHADRPPTGWRRRFSAWGYGVVDGAAFTSLDMAMPFVRSRILPDGVRLFEVLEGSTRFEPGDREAARGTLQVEGAPMVAWVGNLAVGKDPEVALQAFRHALEELPDARMFMVHRGGALEARIVELVSGDPVLAPAVRLLGSLSHRDVELFLRAADVLLASSRHEGSGYAVIEALACGTPVVASSIPAHRAVLGAGAGALAPVGDAAAMGRALVQSARQGREGRDEARRRFETALTFEAIGVQLRSAYEALAGAASGRSGSNGGTS